MFGKAVFAFGLAVLSAGPCFAGSSRVPERDERIRVQEITPFGIHSFREIRRQRDLDWLAERNPSSTVSYERVGDPKPVGVDAALETPAQ